MSASTAAMNPVQPAPPPARPAAGPAPAADEGRFDHHLDAARQQHGQAQDQPAHEDGAHEPQAKDAATAATRPRRPAEAPAKDEGDPDAAALAAAMLALIGQAAPAKPLAHAGAAVPGATGTTTGAAPAAQAPAALVLLANTAATATALKPGNTPGPEVLAPMLAEPARQKKTSPLEDMPLPLAHLSGNPASTATGASPAVPTHQLGIASPPGTPTFAQELGEHVVWLGRQDVKQARIRLHPEELGALDVKVSMNHDRVDVSFAVQHPAAVHAVQQTLPQLDALLAHHGLALGQADVGQRQQQGEGARNGEAMGAAGEIEAESKVMAHAPVAALGMLDTFA